jgi:hypothetical protein
MANLANASHRLANLQPPAEHPTQTPSELEGALDGDR